MRSICSCMYIFEVAKILISAFIFSMESVSDYVKKSYVGETKKTTMEFKCDKCDLVTIM